MSVNVTVNGEHPASTSAVNDAATVMCVVCLSANRGSWPGCRERRGRYPGRTRIYVLNIFVWRNPEVSGSFIVRPDGMITTSLVEDIPVTGKTPTELARSIEEILSTYLRDPIVTVTVGGFVGPFSEQIRIIGEASSPQAISYKQHMTLLDVMIQVGGLTEFADGNGAVLVRIENGQQNQYEIMIDELLKDGKISANVDMLPGDIIIIPEAWF